MILSTSLWLIASYHLRISNGLSWTVTPNLIPRNYVLMICLSLTLFGSNLCNFECVEPGKQPRELYNYTLEMMKNDCKFASKITLLSSDTVVVRHRTQNEVNILFNFTHVDMCTRIFDSRFQHLSLSKKQLTGRCRGPVLDNTSNNDLVTLSAEEFVKFGFDSTTWKSAAEEITVDPVRRFHRHSGGRWP